MTDPGTTTHNTTGPGASVGIQAEAVHNSTVNQVIPGDPPHRKYEVGLRFLEDGVPSRARELINDAIARDHDGAAVRFHWVLALLSKRSHRDLSTEERGQLAHLPATLDMFADDDWKRALEAICELLNHLDGSDSDPGPALKELQFLPRRQHDQILRHLDLVLTGGMKASLWAGHRQTAEDARLENNRLGRVWAYFEPEPAPPRTRRPAENSTTLGIRVGAYAWSCVFATGIGYLGWSILLDAALLPILAFALALAAGYTGARTGLEWHYRTKRIAEKDRAHFASKWTRDAPEDGFADQVDRAFSHYFAKYAPEPAERNVWLTETTGIRRTLRNEVVVLYRETKTGAGEVRWLVRHMVRDVRTRWRSGTLLEHHETYRITAATKALCVLSLIALAPTALSAVIAAVQASPITVPFAVLAAVVSGRLAAQPWLHIISERRRCEEDAEEYERISEQRWTEYRRWKGKLDATRPSEREMENWLSCDKTIILDEAMHHYQVSWHDILALAPLVTPAPGCRRARDKNGPWRYSAYVIRIFLVTKDGVREVTTELDFASAMSRKQERDNYRFEAVSSIQVIETSDLSYTLNLTLMNGPAKRIRITEAEAQRGDSTEEVEAFSQINLDAAGFSPTLRILEGISAEGKMWIHRDTTVKSAGGRHFTAT